ncbi:hypothetical protein TPHA_0C01980 [Tetrapisispora phaffii CBS 4417]|uniref:Ribosomal protein L10 n=1 Tax=Tetrapisispora phaffii (strain ATCC 24235 / CBS 4417 / NBRC 1672 / NRRL Y-8282 / UCD 70-5) TaxID=1071381 RepID=G8BRH7_TETPH|nr:mitochondrial 54S ribosomal protein YmL11 TPHA_0C01980 [Tetrapisispora phaffii CBS 4417]CCE62353.1 hypothetical protein TPHA_0C01980 [Tetrapisispora phaffii CBS 4417]
MNSLRLILPNTSFVKCFYNNAIPKVGLTSSLYHHFNGRCYSIETQNKGTKQGHNKVKLPVRKTVKPIDSRKTFLMDSYKNMMEKSSVVLFLHYNNLLKQEDDFFRFQVKANGGTLKKLRNGVFGAYLRASHLEDPCMPLKKGDKNNNHPLLPLLKGSTAAIVFDETDSVAVSKILKILQRHQDKLFVIGAKVENSVFDIEKLNKFKDLPSKAQLHSQLLGLLHALSGVGLVNTLENASKTLYMTLQSHNDNTLNTEKSEDSEN